MIKLDSLAVSVITTRCLIDAAFGIFNKYSANSIFPP